MNLMRLVFFLLPGGGGIGGRGSSSGPLFDTEPKIRGCCFCGFTSFSLKVSFPYLIASPFTCPKATEKS